MRPQKPYTISTAIPYVNATPHLGHALELVITDAVARHRRLRGRDVRFVTGTDENSLKNVRAAEAAGVEIHELIRRNSLAFRELAEALGVAFDDFVRTSVDARHRLAVETFWKRCHDRGDLYRATYRGLYCVGCERFVDVETEGTVCSEHRAPLETVEEENWFFRLSRYRDALRELYADEVIQVIPAGHRRETEAFLAGEVRDLCVSRSAERAAGWGIPVPGDPEQVIYVWFDALVSYISAFGYGGDDRELRRRWLDAERIHVIGKGITRFHTVYWPAFLLSAGLALPNEILVHGYVTVDGQKIAKTGISVDPRPITTELGADALRYYLLRHIRTTRDGDFRLDRVVEAYNSELANQLGNLVSRTLALVVRCEGGVVPAPTSFERRDEQLRALAERLPGAVDEAVDRFEIDRAVVSIFELIAATNRYVDETAPWALAKEGNVPRLRTVLHCCVQVLATLASELAPFLPGTAEEIGRALGTSGPWGSVGAGTRVTRPSPLFPRRTESVFGDPAATP